MDFEFFVECSFHVSLHFVGFYEWAVHVDSFQVFNNADFLAIVDLLIVLKELGDDSLISPRFCAIAESAYSFLMLWNLLWVLVVLVITVALQLVG